MVAGEGTLEPAFTVPVLPAQAARPLPPDAQGQALLQVVSVEEELPFLPTDKC